MAEYTSIFNYTDILHLVFKTHHVFEFMEEDETLPSAVHSSNKPLLSLGHFVVSGLSPVTPSANRVQATALNV